MRKFSYNFNPDLSFMEKVIEYVKQRDFSNKEIILIYYYLFLADLKEENEEYFSEFRNLASKHSKLLNRNEQHNVYTAMQGYCLRKVTRGNRKYKHVLFEVCMEMVSNRSYFEADSAVIHPLIYKNIVKSGSWVNQFNWTLEFIENHRKELLPEYQDNIYNFCLAFCYFRKGDYSKSMEYLSKLKYENVYDKAEAKRLQMLIYYEMDWTEELFSLSDAYKHFLHNDKLISDRSKNNILNFIQFLNMILKFKIGESQRTEFHSLKKSLQSTDCYEKEWLLEKLEELSQKGNLP